MDWRQHSRVRAACPRDPLSECGRHLRAIEAATLVGSIARRPMLRKNRRLPRAQKAVEKYRCLISIASYSRLSGCGCDNRACFSAISITGGDNALVCPLQPFNHLTIQRQGHFPRNAARNLTKYISEQPT